MRTLEDAILSETQLLVEHISKLDGLVQATNDEQVLQLIDKLRRVEQKMSLVFTFFKASMYSSNIWQQEGAEAPVDDARGTNRPAFR